MTTVEDLLKAGYAEYRPGPLDHESIERKFQKRIDDEVGKKYFINAHKWRDAVHPTTGEKISSPIEFEIQLCDKETGNPVNLLLFGGWTIEDIEKRAEEFWDMGCWKYYEVFQSPEEE